MGNCPASHDWLRVRMMIFKKTCLWIVVSACFSLFQVFALLQTKSWKGKLQGPSLGPSCENIGGFHSHGSTQSLDGLFHGKSQSIMDDGMGYRYDKTETSIDGSIWRSGSSSDSPARQAACSSAVERHFGRPRKRMPCPRPAPRCPWPKILKDESLVNPKRIQRILWLVNQY